MVHPQASVVNLQISAAGRNHKLEACATGHPRLINESLAAGIEITDDPAESIPKTKKPLRSLRLCERIKSKTHSV